MSDKPCSGYLLCEERYADLAPGDSTLRRGHQESYIERELTENRTQNRLDKERPASALATRRTTLHRITRRER